MQPQSSIQIILIVYSALLATGLSQSNLHPSAQNITEINEDQHIKISLTMSQIAQYKFQYQSDSHNEILPLSIDLTPLDGLSDPDIFVSRNKPIPTNALTSADYYDTSLGYSLIVIPKEKIAVNDTFYITVSCSSGHCKLRLNIHKVQSRRMNTSEVLNITFSESAQKIIRLYVPASTLDSPITRIIISAGLLNPDQVEEPLHLYANQGRAPPDSSNHDMYAQDTWFDGKAIVIHDTDAYFCTDCTYTILLHAAQHSVIRFSADTSGSSIRMLMGESRCDAVDYSENVTYIVNLTANGNAESNGLALQFIALSGKASLKANPDRLPTDNSSFYWDHNSIIGTQQLTITPEDRAKAGLKDILYIVVTGIQPTTFELKVFPMENGLIELRHHVPAFGDISLNKTANYLFPVLSHESKNVVVTIEAPESTYVFLKNCESKSNCLVSINEVNEYFSGKKKTSNNGDIFLATNSVKGSISNFHLPRTCSSGTSSDCLDYYAVSVFNSGKIQKSKYTLTAFTTSGIVPLKEGVVLHGTVQFNQSNYYSFTTSEDSDIVVQVTELFGAVDVYVSSQTQSPSSNNYEFTSSLVNTILIPKDVGSQSDKYYIAVHGADASTYTIVAYLQNAQSTGSHPGRGSGDTSSDAPIELSEGISQNITSKSENSVILSLNVGFFSDVGREIQIVLQPLVGNFTIFASNGSYLPTKDTYQFKSTTNKLVITKKSPYFINSGKYFIRIYSSNCTSFNLRCKATVTYVTSNYFVTLLPREEYSDYINALGKMYFRLEINENDDMVYIVSGGPKNSSRTLYVSFTSSNPFPSSDHFELKTNKDVDTLTLERDLVDRTCKSSSISNVNDTDVHRCVIYVTVEAMSNNFFTLAFYTRGDHLQVSEGTPTVFPLREVNQSRHLYFIPTQSDFPIEIIFTSDQINLEMYASVIDRKAQPVIKEWSWPTNTTYSYSSKSSFSISHLAKITIPADRLKNCIQNGTTTGCAVALTAINMGIIDETTRQKITPSNALDLSVDPIFTAVVTSNIVPLEMGKPMLGYVDKSQYKYFQVKVTKAECVLLIIVTPLTDGDPDLYVSYGADIRPVKHLGNAEFLASTFKGEQLEISNEDILPRHSMAGVWTIGVYGNANCSFTITAMYEEEKIIPLLSGVPAHFDILPGKSQYFRWNNIADDEFSLIISEEEGHVTTRVNTMLDEDTLLDRLPRSNGTWHSESSNSRKIMKFSKSSRGADFCVGCTYLIGLSANTHSRGFIIMSLPGKPIYLQNGRPVRYGVDKNSYEYFEYLTWDSMPKVDINMAIYGGNPELYVRLNNPASREEYNWAKISRVNDTYMNLRIRDVKGYDDLNILHIAVYGKEASNYSIMATFEEASVQLSEGVLSYSFIASNESQTYQFKCAPDNIYPNQRLKFHIKVYNDQFSQAQNLTIMQLMQVPEAKIILDNLKKGIAQQTTKVPLLRNETIYQGQTEPTRSQQILKVKAEEGLYTIKVRNPFSHSMNFSIIANRVDIFAIPLGTSHLSRVGVGEIDMYELYVPEPGQLAVRIVSCFGAVKFDAASTLKKLQEREYDIEINYINSDFISFGSTSVEPGTIYVAVQGIEGIVDDPEDPTKEALYNFEASLFSANSSGFPVTLFRSGNNGTLSVGLSDESSTVKKVTVEWSPIEYRNPAETSSSDFSVEYSLIITKHPIFTQSYGLCSYLPKEFSKIARTDTFLYKHKENSSGISKEKMSHSCDLIKDDAYFVGVAAVVRGKQGDIAAWDFPIFYEIREVNLTLFGGYGMYLLVGLGVACGFGLALFVWKCKVRSRSQKYIDMENERKPGDDSTQKDENTTEKDQEASMDESEDQQ